MVEKNKNVGIDMRQVKFIGSVGHCPNCKSNSVRFRLPLECYLETKDGKLNKIVLDFSNPQYWLKETTTKCASCGFEFHLRNHNDSFYQGLEESKKKEGAAHIKWSYDFDSYKLEE